ncbi:carbon-nitrogen hydrolase family protein [Thiofaba sp. EF100]|jgi:nitrilase|uniref:carbon-nitrogen hydrolase family protein n=1 Tax=Thiofaba sp. EF100 TaxID=3121274 RepID=UPI0032218946
MTARVAVIQMVSGADVEANLEQAGRRLAEAANAGARLAVLPENVACMTPEMEHLRSIAEREGEGPIQQALAAMARRNQLWLVAGTIPLLARDGRLTNTCLVFDDDGQRVARYDKIHLFDVDVPGGEVHHESAHFAPGREVVVLDTPVGRLGLAVCYDLRFPELFRAMVDQGAELIALPAAFTHATGRAHWEVLLRARAIENLCFVLASAQGGQHFEGRRTFGHSQVIGPWGEPLALHAEGPGLALATLDRGAQRELRERFPVLAHRVL